MRAGAVGSLHPQFVEWMMGFPKGWTDLDDDDAPATTVTACTPSETPSSPRSPKSSAELSPKPSEPEAMSESPAPTAVAYLRVPLADAEAHRAKLAAAERKVHALGAQLDGAVARVYALEAQLEQVKPGSIDPGLVTLDDIREVLAEEAKRNGDDDEVRECLEWSDEDDTGHIEVVDTVRNMASRLRALAEHLEEARAVNNQLLAGAAPSPAERHACACGAVFSTPQGLGLHFRAGTCKAAAPIPVVVETRAHVATRRDAHGRRFWDGAGWIASAVDAHDSARLDFATLQALKPRGSRLVALVDVPGLIADDEAKPQAPRKPKAPKQQATEPTALEHAATSTPDDVTCSEPVGGAA